MPMRKLKKYKPTRFKAKDSYYDKETADFAVAFRHADKCHHHLYLLSTAGISA